ncbi:ArsR/SmtB family transcription factor [Ruania alba]|uniref:ArsR/SmtB family transcription factor n=1 Tax=Ruania alba TaxID=648782 RepID=UPI000B7F93CD|nr:metalloregulator ArsR/SmtB family transcription factor [Ruania alba]
MLDDDPVFKALADPIRRLLLDVLFEREGRSLGELEGAVNEHVEMTRFGVAKHLRLLEQAGLVVTRKHGRTKLHYLNPVPIQQIHRRWIGKYTERAGIASVLLGMKETIERTASEQPDASDQPDRPNRSDPEPKDEQ